jgi:predicted RNA binding protein YcfA (HicA-like mRNA interferase family)
MPRIAAQHWKTLECIFEKDGFIFERRGSSHNVYSKKGHVSPIIIPRYDNVGIDIIKNNMRRAGMTRERFFKLLAECGG